MHSVVSKETLRMPWPLRVVGGFPFHNLDFFGGEAVEFVDEVVDLAVGGVDLALEQMLL